MLNGDDKLQAFNAIDSWCFVLTTQVHIILLSYQIVFEATYFSWSSSVHAKEHILHLHIKNYV